MHFVAQAKQPFFLYFAPNAPHLPAVPAPADLDAPVTTPKPRPNFNERNLADKPWSALYKRVLGAPAVRFLDRQIVSRQLRSLDELDRQIGNLVGTLRRRGILDNTIIVYASDNGFLWGEHRLGGKFWPYEESIRIPLIVRVPWQTEGRKDSHLVLNNDLASTISELAGVTPGLPQEGRSLVPLLRGATPVPAWRQASSSSTSAAASSTPPARPRTRRSEPPAGSTSSTRPAGASSTT